MNWIDVNKGLPDMLDAVLAVDRWGYMTVCGYDENLGWYPKVDGSHPNWDASAITHWASLPEPPTK